MPSSKRSRVRVRILVKAYPQPSQKYDETVCVAAITEDGREMLRLYPIRYRHLPKDRQFDRFDLVELDVERPHDDHRPESRHVDEDSIRILGAGKKLAASAKVQLWRAHVAPSLKALHEENKATKRSFGIIRPDAGSLKFFVEKEDQADAADRAANEAAFQQVSLLEAPLSKLPAPEYSFGYRFRSGGNPHRHYLHDWEVQAAYIAYRRRYKADALKMLEKEYGERIPTRNPHFIMGTMKAHPQTFIVIGVLRSGTSPNDLNTQGTLFP